MASQAVLPEKADFAAMEEKVLSMWKTIDAFKTSLKLSEGKPEVGAARLINRCAKRSHERNGWGACF
jgi:hypothetical protein